MICLSGSYQYFLSNGQQYGVLYGVQVRSKMLVGTIQEEKTPSPDSNYQQGEFNFWKAILF